jgi:hypothetical protein
MPKRMIDTDLWNNEDIIEYFTAEDKYFWLYLLTNPHNNICGVMRASPVLIARDMGYSKECIQNLLYRFENVHRAIIVDKETHELLILNWGKFNWNKSPDILKTVEKTMNSINSYYLKEILSKKINEVWGKIEEKQQGVNRVLRGCGQDTITITIANIFNYWNDKNIIKHRELTEEISKAIEKALKSYSEDEIKTCIDRYATILGDNEYFWHYKWSLKDFLSRKDGISSFTDEGSKWVSYNDAKQNNTKKTEKPKTRQGNFDIEEAFATALERTYGNGK